MKKNQPESRYGKLWSKEESILAFELYCRIPFQKTKASTPAVKTLARKLGRTPASVARKLGNFGAFDPCLREKKISGLTHTSKLDQEVWEEFNKDWNRLVLKANRIRERIGMTSYSDEPFERPSGASEKLVSKKQRVHQTFFRDAVLSSYTGTCCVTGLKTPECLIASHIVPWSKSERSRTDPTNGLCLSATFDRLFDAGLMTISVELTVRFSDRITESRHPAEKELLANYEGRPIQKPHRFLPANTFLSWHNTHVFKP